MKRFIVAIILFAAISTSTQAQSKDEQQVSAAVEQLRKAMIDPTSENLEKLTSPSLSYGHSSGKIENQQQFIQALVSGASDFLTIDLTDQTVAVTGNTAIVRHVLSGNTSDNGKPNTVKLGVMLVWIKQGKEWKLLGRQATKLAQ